ncbi:aspartate semialdehyde dehydrogenese [Aeromonas diversa CDC 2478-85]|uniref:Aspartate semialdehyde dehydrogenese n=1 Tax=Aeromonas diversa CDC 2478-85 TaxID=1268237 RepID=N9V929_9GAMM|nr:aspartate-semialdehyde dehydrogenase [Aeromonas diversa]ENY71762.1 aspartate semialdehyde dehydrogenese [Aeromonas diversa CDC 2478-85]
MTAQFSVAVLGAGTAAGQLVLELIEERGLPVDAIIPLGSADEVGDTVRALGRNLDVRDVADFDWSEARLALFVGDASDSLRWADVAAEQGCLVLDASGAFVNDDDVPLVCMEANPEALGDYRQRNVVALASGVTSELLAVLKPLHAEVGVARVNVGGYLSVSGVGKAGVDELAGQTAALLNARPVEPACFPAQIAFNLLGHCGELQDNGYSRDEWQLILETQKVLGQEVAINPTLARVPVFYGDALAVHLELLQPLDAEQVKEVLRGAAGVALFEDDQVPSPVCDANGRDEVLVARVRQDFSHPQGVDLWLVADNLRRGAALGVVQAAEYVLRDYF